jgi:hypothetical protein
MRVMTLPAFLLAWPLVGCQTDGPIIPNPFYVSKEEIAAKQAEQAAKDDETCRKYGAKPGTDIYIQCRMSEAQRRTTAESAPGPVIVNNNVDTTPQPSLYPTIQPMNIPGPRCTSRGC